MEVAQVDIAVPCRMIQSTHGIRRSYEPLGVDNSIRLRTMLRRRIRGVSERVVARRPATPFQ